jgi:hypothetical protein
MPSRQFHQPSATQRRPESREPLVTVVWVEPDSGEVVDGIGKGARVVKLGVGVCPGELLDPAKSQEPIGEGARQG